MELNSNQIAELMPHRYPFALVDRITAGEPGQWAKGIKCVTVNEQFFCGHFPQEHVMPGVLILEAMAQVGCVALAASKTPDSGGRSHRGMCWKWNAPSQASGVELVSEKPRPW